ncbi:hypothetical protein BPO_0581 [Bergeyella porcorum]|uniref:Uncharacterized protein n=1 Tax=Bergeyella porcorum TaxID=1735111 RepID=A0AAU0EYG6_9FLAO
MKIKYIITKKMKKKPLLRPLFRHNGWFYPALCTANIQNIFKTNLKQV